MLHDASVRCTFQTRSQFWRRTGLAVLEEVNFDNLPTRVVVLTAAEDDGDVVRAMRLGARGVVLKQSATDLLVRSIQRVHAGEIWLDNLMTAEVMKAFSKSSESGPRREKPLLSEREKEIVQHVAQGFRNKEIGEKLFISRFASWWTMPYPIEPARHAPHNSSAGRDGT